MNSPGWIIQVIVSLWPYSKK